MSSTDKKDGKDTLEDFLKIEIKQPPMQPDDPDVDKKSLGLATVDIKKWVASLSKDEASNLHKVFEDQNKNTSLKYLVKPLLPLVREHKALQDCWDGTKTSSCLKFISD